MILSTSLYGQDLRAVLSASWNPRLKAGADALLISWSVLFMCVSSVALLFPNQSNLDSLRFRPEDRKMLRLNPARFAPLDREIPQRSGYLLLRSVCIFSCVFLLLDVHGCVNKGWFVNWGESVSLSL